MIRPKFTILAALLFLVCATAYGDTIYVHQGDNLQLKIDQAQRGDVLILDAGATFAGPIQLPPKAGTGYVTIQSSALSLRKRPSWASAAGTRWSG